VNVQSINRTEVDVLATALDALYDDYQDRHERGGDVPLTLDELDELCRMRNMVDVLQHEFRQNDSLEAMSYSP